MTNARLTQRGGASAVIVFVHGLFGDCLKTWRKFPELVLADSGLAHCDVLCWGYSSSTGGFLPRVPFLGRKTPSVELVAASLFTDLRNPRLVAPSHDIVLVGHSMGGLVILRALLLAGRQDPSILGRVRRVMLYATPVEGVQANAVLDVHPQARQLRVDSDLIRSICAEWKASFSDADDPATVGERRTVPVTAIVGQADNAVPETSARAFFEDVETVPGNHTEMCKPADLADSAFQTLRARVLESAPGPFLLGTKAVQQANARAIASARQVIFTIGSRSRDERYLRSIEDRLRADSALIYYRVLMGRPRRRALWEHIERVLGFRDVADRSTGQRTLYVGLYDRPDEQAEINLMGTETMCTVILPPAEGVGTYSTAMCFRDGAHVDSYRKLAHELMGRGSDIRSLDDLRRLVPDPPSK